jgi:hypothetical protein
MTLNEPRNMLKIFEISFINIEWYCKVIYYVRVEVLTMVNSL